jgi:glyoxylase I family protein
MILGIHHTAISTPDIDRMTRFYCDVMGFQVISTMTWDKGAALPDTIMGLRNTAALQAKLRAGNCFIELFEFRSPAPKPADPDRQVNDHGYTHLCLHVRDLDAEYQRLRALGMAFNSEPQRRPTHSSVYGRDPDGNVIELLEVFDARHPFAMSNAALP